MFEFEKLLLDSLSGLEWAAFLHICTFVFAITQILIRLAVRFDAVFNPSVIYTLSISSGFIGAFFLWPAVSTVPWFIIGPTAVGITAFVRYSILVFIRWRYPALADIISSEKRMHNRPPPGGIERRKKKP